MKLTIEIPELPPELNPDGLEVEYSPAGTVGDPVAFFYSEPNGGWTTRFADGRAHQDTAAYTTARLVQPTPENRLLAENAWLRQHCQHLTSVLAEANRQLREQRTSNAWGV